MEVFREASARRSESWWELQRQQSPHGDQERIANGEALKENVKSLLFEAGGHVHS